jgi:hemerythrin
MKSHFLGRNYKARFDFMSSAGYKYRLKHYDVHTKFRSNNDEVQSSLTSVICTIGKKFLVSTDCAMR